MDETYHLLGFDIGGTKCAVLIGTADGCVLFRTEWPSRAERGPDAMLADLCREAAVLLEKAPAVRAAGVSIGGPLDASRGVVLSPPNLPGWDEIPLKRILADHLSLPVAVEHDAAACALAEYEWGLSRKPRRLIYLTCATGFGAGMIFDGVPYYGVFGRSPEIGHVFLDKDGPEAFGMQGCAEAFCSAKSMGRLAARRRPDRWATPPSPRLVQDLAAAGDPDARWVIETNARMTGRVCALLADLLHPDHIALGSLARFLGTDWVDAVRHECCRLALAEAADHCMIEAARLGSRLQDLSTLAAAKRALCSGGVADATR